MQITITKPFTLEQPVCVKQGYYEDDQLVIWDCNHADVDIETYESYDHYMAAVTGRPQALAYYKIEVCNGCKAWRHYEEDIWQTES